MYYSYWGGWENKQVKDKWKCWGEIGPQVYWKVGVCKSPSVNSYAVFSCFCDGDVKEMSWKGLTLLGPQSLGFLERQWSENAEIKFQVMEEENAT